MTDGEARVRRVIAGLHYDFSRFTIPHFIAHLEALRQREIILNGVAFDGRLHGLWVRAETADYVFFDSRTHPVHRVHHILHEVGHMVLGHRLHDLAAFLSPELVAQLRGSAFPPNFTVTAAGGTRTTLPTNGKPSYLCACCNKRFCWPDD